MYRLIFKLFALLVAAVPAAGRFVPSPGPDPSPARGAIHAVRLARPTTMQPRVSATTSAISVSLQEVNPGAVVERGLCLSIAVGEGAAAECGDLRLVHPLPSTRTLNKLRTPVLLYGSATAHPHPLVAADVVLPRGSTGLLRVVGSLFINGKLRARSAWSGSHWPASGAARIALGFDALSDATNLYRDSLLVEAYYTGTGGESADTGGVSGDLAIVNRAHSPFGAGWWLAGYEQLLLSRWGEPVLWVGGDGSVLPYTKVADSVWVAPNPSRPDTLKRVGSGFMRFLPGGVRVAFDERGRDTATIDRLGHRTRFHYRNDDLLGSVILPLPGSADTTARYDLSYAGGKLQRVDAPGPTQASPRTTTLHRTGIRVDSITDPDSTVVAFGYTDASARVASRTDRVGTVTDFHYDAGGKLSGSTVEMEGTGDDIVTTLWAQESVGLADTLGTGAGAVDTSLVYALLDGPRDDVADTTRFWLDRFGAPRVIHDALGHTTTLLRGDGLFPALVTRIEYPQLADGRRRVDTATYDARGNLKTSTQVNPYGDGQNATTRYERTDLHWPDFVTRIVPPLGDSTVIAYDSVTGNRLWQQDARGNTSRINFGYGDSGLLTSITYPDGAKDSLTYDAGEKNLFTARTPRGFVTTFYKDNIGRDTLAVSPIDSLQSFHQKQRSIYDLMDRVTLSQSIGPALGTAPAETLSVRTYYNLEGAADSVERWSSPDPTSVGHIKTRWTYDAALRVVKEIAPDLKVDSTFYDPAGNPVEVHTRRIDPISGARLKITMQYDALNRLLKRKLPPVVYPSRFAGIAQYRKNLNGENPQYPKYPNNGSGGYTVFADSTIFDYDPSGGITRADNSDAQVSRTYYASGQIKTETQKIRTLTGSDFSQHQYTIEYRYDLEGRLAGIKHPTQLGPTGTGNDSTKYVYQPFGPLWKVVDALGDTVRLEYDAAGYLRDTYHPGGLHEHSDFDTDGRLTANYVANGSTSAYRHTEAYLRNARFRFDARSKMLWSGNSAGWRDTTTASYSGLGYAVLGTLVERGFNPAEQPVRFSSTETSVFDAFANRTSVSTQAVTDGTSYQIGSSRSDAYRYAAGTGRLRAMSRSSGRDTLYYDGAGNTEFSTTNSAGGHDRASYYAADGRLRAADDRISEGREGTQFYTAFEEYRYDALGRRVWVRARRWCEQDTWLGACRLDKVRRIVWDGERELYEIQMPGDSPSTYFESDTAHVSLAMDRTVTPNFDPNPFFGRVAYAHGAATDQPLSVIRIGYVDRLDYKGVEMGSLWEPTPFAILPLWSARGQPELGAYADGGINHCAVSGGDTLCVRATWPGQHFVLERPKVVRNAWHGSLVEDKEDAAGTFDRRNRAYDPTTGQFTQEDPIGLAGGLNLYGFANGDAVTFSDPFGLCIWDGCIGEAILAATGLTAAEAAISSLGVGIAATLSVNHDRVVRAIDQGLTTLASGLHRPYIRKWVRDEVASRARRTADGRFRDPNTGRPINGRPDLGHVRGREFWREKAQAGEEGLSQKEFNDRMNDPDIYQLEDPSSNRSHRHELPRN